MRWKGNKIQEIRKRRVGHLICPCTSIFPRFRRRRCKKQVCVGRRGSRTRKRKHHTQIWSSESSFLSNIIEIRPRQHRLHCHVSYKVQARDGLRWCSRVCVRARGCMFVFVYACMHGEHLGYEHAAYKLVVCVQETLISFRNWIAAVQEG